MAAPPADRESLRWQHVVISLQTLLSCPVHVGGRTALELEGFAHYLHPAGPREIHLYGAKAFPNWLTRLKLDTSFVFHNAGKLFEAEADRASAPQERTDRANTEADTEVARSSLKTQSWGQWEWPLIIIFTGARRPRIAGRGSAARDVPSGRCSYGGPAQP